MKTILRKNLMTLSPEQIHISKIMMPALDMGTLLNLEQLTLKTRQIFFSNIKDDILKPSKYHNLFNTTKSAGDYYKSIFGVHVNSKSHR